MRTAIDILLVTVAVGIACLYAFLKLAPRELRGRLAARLGRRAEAAAKPGSCGGCGDCESKAETEGEVRIAVSEVSRRR